MIWKVIPGHPDYEVSDEGEVRSNKQATPRILKPHRQGRGLKYLKVNLWCGSRDKRKQAKVHQLVAEAFLGPCPEGCHVRHLDGDPSNNHVSNLAYGTQSENENDKLQSGTYGMKLTVLAVKAIRSLAKIGFPHKRLAQIFGVNPKYIGRVIRRQSWANVV